MSGLGAFIETVKVYKELNVTGHIWEMGRKLCAGLRELAKEYMIEDHFYLTGAECSPNMVICGKDKKPSFEYRTVFCQEMIKPLVSFTFIDQSQDLFCHNSPVLFFCFSSV